MELKTVERYYSVRTTKLSQFSETKQFFKKIW